MDKVNVSLKIDGKVKYESKGVGTLNRDILIFKDDKCEYVFDFKTNRITEIDKDKRVIIDLEDSFINIIGENNLFIEIHDVDKRLKENSYEVSYELEGIISITLEWSKYE